MSAQRPFSPAAYQHRLNSRAKERSRRTGESVSELVSRHYHRRLVARVFTADPDGWLLKGGQALLMRWQYARHSVDIDLQRAGTSVDLAVESLIQAAGYDLNDHLRFEHFDTAEPANVERLTRKVRFRVLFGGKELQIISVDVIAAAEPPHGAVLTERLEPPIKADGDSWPLVRLFPIEDHIAEKICALYERHRAEGRASSRYKDLVDLALIATRVELHGPNLHATVRDEARRRQRKARLTLELPARFELPDDSWTAGYRASARDVRELPTELRTLDGARDLLSTFLDPLLNEEPPTGWWKPNLAQWR